MSRKIIGITFGDVAGVGPEIIYKALASEVIPKDCSYCLFGSKSILDQVKELLPYLKINRDFYFYEKDDRKLLVDDDQKGQVSAEFGALACQWLTDAVTAWKNGEIHGLVTAPINKRSCHLSGFKFQGHTDFLSYQFGNPEHKMCFYSDEIKLLLVTHHLSLRNALSSITIDMVEKSIETGCDFMKQLGIKTPLILVGGINPHAGEDGSMGEEERKIIAPAILKARKRGINVRGPFPPDTIALDARSQKDSLLISMTHDLGLIPFKLIAFDRGVNVTIGLPMVRTSPDHGTAYDIAWKGIAASDSMIEAVKLCYDLINQGEV